MSTTSVWLTRANGLSMLRLMCAPALVLAIDSGAAPLAVALFVLAVATDFADGFVARRFGEESGLGRLVDHSTDAIFVSAGTAALACADRLPVLLPTLIALSFIQYAVDTRNPDTGPRPSPLGRWNGIAYYVVLAVPIFKDALGLGWPPEGLIAAMGWALVATTLVSMADRLRFTLRG
jgi:cardiolipin synthase